MRLILKFRAFLWISAAPAMATFGPVYFCHDPIQRIIARVMPEKEEVEVERLGPQGRKQLFTDCEYNSSSYRLLYCTEPAGRVFIMNSDMTARYIGSFPDELSCFLAHSHADSL